MFGEFRCEEALRETAETIRSDSSMGCHATAVSPPDICVFGRMPGTGLRKI
jgi:hypothetical protein